MLLAGPVVCGMSQAANDWFDRHVDAVNEPHRPIPSGRIPGRWGLWIALAMSVLSLAQVWAMKTLLADPKGKAPWYNATGIAMYVSGMMITAFAIRTLEVAP